MLDDIAIKVENITKTYRLYNSNLDRLKESLHPLRYKYHHEFNALQEVSFQIKKGEVVGILGKNGSGKSTLLKAITGVLTPTYGSVTVNGRISALLELGSGFNPELTGIENIYFNGTLMGYSRSEMDALLDDILAFADIGEFVYQPVKSYSSGMFLRLAFAVAVNVDPEILIVDEALAVGDLMFRRKCKEKINRFREKNATILLVSHSMSEVKAMCSRGIYLENGKLAVIGSASDAVNAYMIAKDNVDDNNISTDTIDDIFGTQDIIIDNVVCYENNSSIANNQIAFGSDIIIELKYRVITEIIRPVIRVNIGSRGYKGFASIDNINHGFKYDKLDGSGIIKIIVSGQNLYPGNYTIDIGIISEIINIHYFVWNSAAEFTVLPPNDRLLCAPYALIELGAKYIVERD